MNNLKFYRARACLTMGQVAQAIGTSRQTVCAFESEVSHRTIPTHKVDTLAQLLSCNRFELLGEESFVLTPSTNTDKVVLIKQLFDSIQGEEAKESVRQYVQKK